MGMRAAWMDQARGIAIVLVVLHHSMTWAELFGLQVPPVLVVFDAAFLPFRMPLLMFLSGMLVTRSLGKPTATYFAGKWRGIGWPYLLWTLIFLSLTGTLTLSLVPNILVYPPTYLWYLWFLFAFYVVAWVLARFQVPPLPVAALALAASAVAPEEYRISRFFFLMSFFMLGWWWQRAGIGERGSHRLRMLVAATGFAAGAVISGISIGGTPTRYVTVYAWGVIALIAALALVLPGARSGRYARPIEFVGRNSIVFYVVHYPLLWVMDVLLVQTWGWTEVWVVWAVGVAAAIAAGSALSVARSRSRGVGTLFAWPVGTRVAERSAGR